jgi:oxygen-independent coproporphyrinogen-3 oxidase
MERYVERVREDLRSAVSAHAGMPRMADTIYLGGGTPSLLPPELLKTLFGAIYEQFQMTGEAEITVECAPGQLADETLDAMLECGVNRISFGVQSFIDREAKAAGRLHTRAMALEDIRRVRRAGIQRVNADLIAGLPHQTADSWSESLAVLAETGVDHASIYMLEVDDDSRLGREVLNGGARYFAPAIPSDDAIADMYIEAVDVLAKHGLTQYEISNFARGSGAESLHNKRYWLRKPYLGLGVDAHSMLRGANGEAVRFAATDNLENYLEAPGWNDLHVLTRREEIEEAWFLGLRLHAGVSLCRLAAEFGSEVAAAYNPIVETLLSEGLLANCGDRVALTAQGRLLSNEVFARFLDGMEISEPATV